MLNMTFGESTKSRTQVQLRHNRFKEDREDVNNDARSGRPSTSTTGEILKQSNHYYKGCQWCWHIVRLMPTCFRQQRLFPNWKIWTKTTSLGHRSGDVDDLQQRSRFGKIGHNRWRSMDIWNQSSIIAMETSRRAKTEKKLQVRSNVFFSIAVAWCIMNSCHKVVRSIRIT